MAEFDPRWSPPRSSSLTVHLTGPPISGVWRPRLSLRSGGAATLGDHRMVDRSNETRRLDRPDRVDALIELVYPSALDVLQRLEGDEFTTTDFVSILLSDDSAAEAYNEAIRRWGEGERYAKMVVHGQVIPGVLRRSLLVEWIGFAHGEEDPYGVPARWRLLRTPR